MTNEKNNKRVQKEKPIVKGTHKKTAPKKNTSQKKFLYSLHELSDFFGLSHTKMSSLYKIRGIDEKVKMSIDEAREKFKNIRI